MSRSLAKEKFSKFVKVKLRSFENLNDDFSNALYLANETYLIRDSASLKDPLVSYRNEKRVLDHLEDLDVTEKIIYYSPINGFKIARNIKVSRVYYELNDATILEFIRMIKKMQKISIDNISVFDPVKAIQLYKSKCPETDHLKLTIENRILKGISQDKLPKVVSQSLVEKNKVKFFENKTKICDFRFTCLNSPLFDLAYFSNSYNLKPEQDLYVLNKFFGYKMKVKYVKLFAQYKKYINLLRYYRNCYYYTTSGEISYLDIKNDLKSKIN